MENVDYGNGGVTKLVLGGTKLCKLRISSPPSMYCFVKVCHFILSSLPFQMNLKTYFQCLKIICPGEGREKNK